MSPHTTVVIMEVITTQVIMVEVIMNSSWDITVEISDMIATTAAK